jgi:hypothetical protein
MPIKESVVVPECDCPVCGKKLNRVSGVDNEGTPSEGDFTVCIACSSLLVFMPDLTVRMPTVTETELASTIPIINRLQRTISMVNG